MSNTNCIVSEKKETMLGCLQHIIAQCFYAELKHLFQSSLILLLVCFEIQIHYIARIGPHLVSIFLPQFPPSSIFREREKVVGAYVL